MSVGEALRSSPAPRSGAAMWLATLLDIAAGPPSGPILVADRIRLQPAALRDFEVWRALREASRAHLTAWEPAWRDEDSSPRSFRLRVRVYWREQRRGTGLPLFIFRRGDDALLGGVSLTHIRYGAARSAGIGYWIGERFTRQGYGRAAVTEVVRYAFETLALNRVEAACQPDNVASQKLLESVGFEREGLARDYLRINGRWRDHALYGMTAGRRAAAAG